MFERTCKRVGCGKIKTVPRARKVLQLGSSLSSGTSELRDHRALRLHLMYMYISFAYMFTYAAITYFRLPGFCNIVLLFLTGWKKLRLFFFFFQKPHQFSKAAGAAEMRLHWNFGFKASTTLKSWLISPNP